MRRDVIRITEYGVITRGKKSDHYAYLSEDEFDVLEKYLLENSEDEDSTLDIMGLSARKDLGKIIVAKNHVGMVALRSGITIEILPKVYDASGNGMSIDMAKKLLIDMLRTLRTSSYKSLQLANVDIEKMDIFEIFIDMFIREVGELVRRGIKSGYESVESNEEYVKGKIDFNKDIRYNFAHAERKYVIYDEYTTNRVENRLVKATLELLYKITRLDVHKHDIVRLLNFFDDVDTSVNYIDDFQRVAHDRSMADYANTLMWCRVFLEGKSFTSYSGEELSFALLFPMDKLFESYIATKIKCILGRRYKVSPQDNRYRLYDTPSAFALRPDIVITDKVTNEVYVMDTKWKMLSTGKTHYGISTPDMYQMYVYDKKYCAHSVTLLYPLSDKVNSENSIAYTADDGVRVNIRFVNLFDTDKSLRMILEDILGDIYD